MTNQMKCPDCGTAMGQPHQDDCDVQRCSVCGEQRISCDCEGQDPRATAWNGEWPNPPSMSFSELAALHEEEPEELKEAHMRKYRIYMDEETEADAFYFFDRGVNGLRLDAQCLQRKTQSPAVREFALGVEQLMLAISALSTQLQAIQQEASK